MTNLTLVCILMYIKSELISMIYLKSMHLTFPRLKLSPHLPQIFSEWKYCRQSRPGCLPHFKSGPPRIPHTCYVTGWGYIKDDGEYMRGSSVGTGAHSPCWLSLHGKGHDVWLSCFTPLSIMNRVWAQTLSWLENSVWGKLSPMSEVMVSRLSEGVTGNSPAIYGKAERQV